MSLAGRHAVITGASGAIGSAVAAALAVRGTRLTLLGRRADALAEAAGRALAAGGEEPCAVRTYRIDLCSDPEIRQFAQYLGSVDPSVDLLVHSAGAVRAGTVERSRPEDFDEMVQVNLRAPFVLTRELLPRIPAPGGQIVFVNSSSGLRPSSVSGLYGATKHALAALADSLRNELNPRGIRVTSIYPGRTAGPLQAALFAAEGRPYAPELLLQPGDIAEMVRAALELPWTAEVTEISIRSMRKP